MNDQLHINGDDLGQLLASPLGAELAVRCQGDDPPRLHVSSPDYDPKTGRINLKALGTRTKTGVALDRPIEASEYEAWYVEHEKRKELRDATRRQP